MSESARGVGNGATGTNTQEAGVDEPDVAKTDGRIVVRLQENSRLVITDVRGDEPREIADWRLPDGSQASGLLLVDDHVIVSGDRGPIVMESQIWPGPGGPGGGSVGTELFDVDISVPSRPRLDSRTSWTGRALSLRQYDDTVRLVTATGLPALPFVQAQPGRLTDEQATARNREVVRASRVTDWLPGVSSGSESRPLVACSEVFHPTIWSGTDTVAVATFRPGAADSAAAVAVTGAGSEVYSSTDRMYVTSTDWTGPMPLDGISRPIRPLDATRTHLHSFELTDESVRYVASGAIKGSIRDRWSMDEHDGHLRVAVTWPDPGGQQQHSGVVVLSERNGRLEQVGELRGLGVGEQIMSVRWFDDLAIVVTFRQIDPLYTIDLADPTAPRRLGELKIPGFSSYLHPIGDGLLLGLGTDATRDGEARGAQAAVFDINDPRGSRQVSKVSFGDGTMLPVAGDPHAFTWLPGAGAAITSLERGSRSPGAYPGTAPVLLRVSGSGSVSVTDLPSPGGWQQRALPLDGDRVALVGDTVRLIDVRR